MIAEDDRGFLLGDGVFDTMRIEDGRILLRDRHMRRLRRSLDAFRIPFADNALEQAYAEAAAAIPEGQGSARITISRGSGPRGLLPPARPKPTCVVTAARAGPRKQNAVPVILSGLTRNESAWTSRFKALNYTDNVLARMEAEDEGADDAILLTNRRYAACTSCANLYVLKAGRWTTPPLSAGGVLEGVVREVLLEAGAAIEEETAGGDLLRFPLARSNSLVGVEPLHLRGGVESDVAAAESLTKVLNRAETSGR